MEKHNNPSSRPLVIIVDDDMAVRDSLQFSLQIEGFRVRSYPGAWGLLIEGLLPECGCLVVDQNMSDITGLDLIARLREYKISTPAILITSDISPALSKRAENAGIPIVPKPLLGNALSERIHQLLGQTPQLW